jgi:hypothetical protein
MVVMLLATGLFDVTRGFPRSSYQVAFARGYRVQNMSILFSLSIPPTSGIRDVESSYPEPHDIVFLELFREIERNIPDLELHHDAYAIAYLAGETNHLAIEFQVFPFPAVFRLGHWSISLSAR